MSSEEIRVFQACTSSRYQLRKLERFKHALMEIRVFQAYACGRCCDTETSRSLSLLRTCACAQVRLLPFSLSCHTGGMSLCAFSACTHVDVVTPSWIKFDEKHHPLSAPHLSGDQEACQVNDRMCVGSLDRLCARMSGNSACMEPSQSHVNARLVDPTSRDDKYRRPSLRKRNSPYDHSEEKRQLR